MTDDGAGLPKSLAELVDLRAAESTFQRLLSTLHHQEKQIQQLQSSMTALERKAATDTDALASKLTSIEVGIAGRMDVLESAVKLPNVKNASLGSIVAANYKEIVSLREKVRDKVDPATVVDACRRVESTLSDELCALRKDTVNLELLSSWHKDQDALHAQLAALTVQVNSKLDKIDLTRTEAAACKLDAFIPRCAAVESSLTQLHSRLDDLTVQSQREMHDASIQRTLMRHALEELHIVTATSRADWTSAVARVDALVQKCRRHIDACHETLQAHTKRCVAHRAVDCARVDAIAQTMADHTKTFNLQLQTKLAQAEWTKGMNAVHAQLATKADRADVAATNAHLRRVDEANTHCASQIDVSVRFIDWFFQRGDAYEHNLQLMEAQLKALAMRPPRRRREPFERTDDRLLD
ncbi:Aste57867_11888 [Aphanomyces stellatus]|uniref:Aste57867_11888 protein n=1 Tax=Aphanomyces stellatus TaxID=120398 RepID=A0A485KW49_9STRA|nr:hypothetical protein As57867_011843 [Aphanomyces stellatus]VFT88743.1 Aste57867_11888 [Aphanomyces stellatus]